MNTQLKATDILTLSNKLYFAGYCELQCITDLLEKVGYYATKTDGWRCDIYKIDSKVYLLTGYDYPRIIGKNKMKELDYDLVYSLNKKYQEKGLIPKTPANKRKAVNDILKLINRN